MRYPMAMATISLLLLTAPQALAGPAQRGFHSPFDRAEGERAKLPLTLVDGSGHTWDLQQDGSVSNGTSDAFDTAMTVEIGGASPRFQGAGVLLEDGRLLVLPTVETAAGVQLTRSIHVPSDEGHARWVDVLHNPGKAALSTTVAYRLGLGSDAATRLVATTGEDASAALDRGWVTDDADPNAGDPAVAVVFADTRGTTEPVAEVTDGNDNPRITYQVEIPPRSSVGIAVIVAQRFSSDDAVSWLQSFASRDALQRIDCRILNFPYMAGFHVPGLLRGNEWDLVELRNGNRLKGTLQVPTWEVDTPYGLRSIAREEVAGVIFGAPGTAQDALVLLRGEVLVGDVGSGPLSLKAAWGGNVPVPRRNIARLGLAQPADPDDLVAATAHRLILRRGDQLRGQILGESLRLAATHGTLELPFDRIARIDLTADGARLHEVTLADGSVLSGIVLDASIRLVGVDGEDLELALSSIESVEAPPLLLEPAIDPDSPVLTLTSGDRWYARPAKRPLRLATSFGPMDLPLTQIDQITFGTPHPGFASVLLAEGSQVTGHLGADELTFRLGCGVELTVPLVFLECLE